MVYDYSKLNGRIVEKCGTRSKFASRIGLSERSLSLKLNNKVAFKQYEIQKALSVLEIENKELPEYFFCPLSSK